jgi:hypothetical protein
MSKQIFTVYISQIDIYIGITITSYDLDVNKQNVNFFQIRKSVVFKIRLKKYKNNIVERRKVIFFGRRKPHFCGEKDIGEEQSKKKNLKMRTSKPCVLIDDW